MITIYHNPACGTSRNVLAFIRERGIEPVVIEYLKVSWTKQKLADLIKKMGIPVRDVLRQKGQEALWDKLKLHNQWDDEDLLHFMVEHPILINRPIVVTETAAKLCRPSEAVLALLPPQ